jgi:hypothetical protein
MQLGLLVLSAIIIFNVAFMIFLTRMILTEPPHKKPTPHPWVLEYATGGDASATDEDTQADSSDNGDSSPAQPAAEA